MKCTFGKPTVPTLGEKITTESKLCQIRFGAYNLRVEASPHLTVELSEFSLYLFIYLYIIIYIILVNTTALGLAYPAARSTGAIGHLVITRCNLVVSDMYISLFSKDAPDSLYVYTVL